MKSWWHWLELGCPGTVAACGALLLKVFICYICFVGTEKVVINFSDGSISKHIFLPSY